MAIYGDLSGLFHNHEKVFSKVYKHSFSNFFSVVKTPKNSVKFTYFQAARIPSEQPSTDSGMQRIALIVSFKFETGYTIYHSQSW